MLLASGWLVATVCIEFIHGKNYPWVWEEFCGARKPYEFQPEVSREGLVEIYGMNRAAENIDQVLVQELDPAHLLT